MQGIEPWTFALLARRSNQLSYTAMSWKLITQILFKLHVDISLFCNVMSVITGDD